MTALTEFLFAPLRYRTLYIQLVRREVVGRYKGSLLGFSWAFAMPLLMLGVYTFVFVSVFGMRWPGAEASGGGAFALRLFAGLIVFNLFSEVTTRAPSLVLEQPNLVKRVVFPLPLMAHVSLSAALIHLMISLGVLFAATLTFEGVAWGWLLTPIVLLPLVPALLGISWLFSSAGVFVRDLGHVVGVAVSLLLFLSPVFYSSERLPPLARFWVSLNPIAKPIENLRICLFGDPTTIDWWIWSVTLVAGICLAWFGAWFFDRVRDGFADAL